MASKASRDTQPAVDVDMTPLIDITFLLLVFFMVINVMQDLERMAVKELPIAYQAEVEPDVSENRMLINIQKNGTIVIYNQKTNIAGLKRKLNVYTGALKKIMKQTGSAPIVVRGHKDVHYKHVKGVLGAIYEAGIKKIMFAAFFNKDNED